MEDFKGQSLIHFMEVLKTDKNCLEYLTFTEIGHYPTPNYDALNCGSVLGTPLNFRFLSLKEQYRIIICLHKQISDLENPILELTGSEFYLSWAHNLFDDIYFDSETFFQKMYNYILNNHNWDSEPQDWKNEMSNKFGINWKIKVSQLVSFEGLGHSKIESYKEFMKKYFSLQDNLSLNEYEERYLEHLYYVKNENNEFPFSKPISTCD